MSSGWWLCELNGLPLYVSQVDDTKARALVVHQYPGGSTPDLEDMGAEAHITRITATVWGEDWRVQLRALEAAIADTTAEHELFHPVLGLLRGRVRSLDVAHEEATWRSAQVRLEFVEGALVPELGTVTSSPAVAVAAVELAAADARAAMLALEVT